MEDKISFEKVAKIAKRRKKKFQLFNSFIAKYVRFGSIFVFVTPKYLVR